MVALCELKICHSGNRSASLGEPFDAKQLPLDGIFNLHLTTIEDSYILLYRVPTDWKTTKMSDKKSMHGKVMEFESQ